MYTIVIDPQGVLTSSKFYYDNSALSWLDRYSHPLNVNGTENSFLRNTTATSTELVFDWVSYDTSNFPSQYFPVLPNNVPAQVREVFDVSGAGDTVIAVMATLLAAGIDMRVAVAVANRAAGLAISRLGTAAVTMNELMSSLH